MSNITENGQKKLSTVKGYGPSVPISVYRELAVEMQASQGMLESLKTQNQQLIGQNQQLRQEIKRLVESAIYLQQLANTFEPVASPGTPQKLEPVPTAMGTRIPDPPDEPMDEPMDEVLFTELEEGRYRRPAPPEAAADASGLWLAVGIFIAIVVFGASFLIVRPLLQR